MASSQTRSTAQAGIGQLNNLDINKTLYGAQMLGRVADAFGYQGQQRNTNKASGTGLSPQQRAALTRKAQQGSKTAA